MRSIGSTAEVGGVLCGQDFTEESVFMANKMRMMEKPTYFITDSTLLHPLSDPSLGVFKLVVVRRINEVS